MASGPNSAAMACKRAAISSSASSQVMRSKRPSPLAPDAPLRIEQAVGRVFALQIAGDFAAQKSARDGMLGIAAQAGAFAVLDVDQQGAGVGTIERADGMADVGRQAKIIATGGGFGTRRPWG